MTGASVVPLSICVQSVQLDPSSGVGHSVVIKGWLVGNPVAELNSLMGRWAATARRSGGKGVV